MRYLFLFFALLTCSTLVAQNKTPHDSASEGNYIRVPVKPSKLTVGIEQDALPYILKGFILTGWMGRDFFRYRVSYAEANTPGFTHGEGISKDRVNAFGLSFEYFFKENYKGLWFGPGIGYWTNYVTSENNHTKKNQSMIFSFGGGYNIYLTSWLYVSPWVATHFRVSGYDSFTVGNATYKPAIITPEVSLKIGVKIP